MVERLNVGLPESLILWWLPGSSEDFGNQVGILSCHEFDYCLGIKFIVLLRIFHRGKSLWRSSFPFSIHSCLNFHFLFGFDPPWMPCGLFHLKLILWKSIQVPENGSLDLFCKSCLQWDWLLFFWKWKKSFFKLQSSSPKEQQIWKIHAFWRHSAKYQEDWALGSKVPFIFVHFCSFRQLEKFKEKQWIFTNFDPFLMGIGSFEWKSTGLNIIKVSFHLNSILEKSIEWKKKYFLWRKSCSTFL